MTTLSDADRGQRALERGLELVIVVRDYGRDEITRWLRSRDRDELSSSRPRSSCATTEQLTADHVSRGRRRVGIGMLFEVLRWHYGRTTTGDEFRLNNNFRSRYVRLLIDQHPEWTDVFELRELRAS